MSSLVPRSEGTAAEGRPVEILLVEDNPGDARLTAEAVKETEFSANLHVTTDGVEALAFLRREGQYADAVRPDIILLDLNMPRKDGREVLAEIKEDPALKQIPVGILTTSQADLDVAEAYDMHANWYITKPMDLAEFVRVIQAIERFWLMTARLPEA